MLGKFPYKNKSRSDDEACLARFIAPFVVLRLAAGSAAVHNRDSPARENMSKQHVE
jgi:hypothetical protein